MNAELRETLELARMHERAFAALGPSNGTHWSSKRAEIFFTEALTPIVETHRAARQSKLDLNRLTETLDAGIMQPRPVHRCADRIIVRRVGKFNIDQRAPTEVYT